MNIEKIYIVNSKKCLKHIKSKNCLIFTESPYVLNTDLQTKDINTILTQDEKINIYEQSDKLGLELNQKLIESFFSSYKIDNMYIFQPHRLFRTLLIKVAILNKLKEIYKQNIEIIIDKEEEFEVLDGFAAKRFGNILAYIGSYLDDKSIIIKKVNEYSKVDVNLVNDTREKNLFLRLCNLDFRILINYFLKKINLKTVSFKRILSYSQNESTREIDAYLRTNKIDSIYIEDKFKIPLLDEKITYEVSYKIDRCVESLNLGIFDSEFKNSLKIILKSAFEKIIAKTLEKEKFIFTHWESSLKSLPSHEKIILVHKLFGLNGFLILNFFISNGYKVVRAVHGLALGVSKINDDYLVYNGDLIGASEVFVFSETAKKVCNNKLLNINTYNIGAPVEIKNPKLTWLQKNIVKKKYNLKSKTSILFASTLIARNSYIVYNEDSLTDIDAFFLEKKVLKSLSKIDKEVIYKPYPTKNYLDDNCLLKSAEKYNFRIFGNEDLRYLRFYPDIFITMTPTSTLSWLIGTSKPLVYLDSSENNVLSNSRVKKIFKKCFFVFNYDKENWDEELIAFLNKPYFEIIKLWKEKEIYRKKYDKELFLSFENHSGKLGSEIISKMLNDV